MSGRNCCSATMSALKAHCGLVVLGWMGHPRPPDRIPHRCAVGVNRNPPVCCRVLGDSDSKAFWLKLWLKRHSTRNLSVLWHRVSLGVGFCVCCRDPGDCLFLVCAVAIQATVFPLCLCGLAALVSRKVLVMGGDGLQTQNKKSWVSGQVRAERVLRPACGRGGVAGVVGTHIPSGLQGEHKQATHAKNKEWYSGSSSSSEGEEWKSQGQEEIKRLQPAGPAHWGHPTFPEFSNVRLRLINN